jgi:hypothetical protein
MMEKDDTLKQLFEDFAPELNPDKDFMQRLQRKLDAVEFIRQRQKAQMRIYHYYGNIKNNEKMPTTVSFNPSVDPWIDCNSSVE